MDIPPEVEILKNDLIWARHSYNQYKKLYMANRLRIQLLNEVAPGFFRLIQAMFWEQMVVNLSRLTGSYQSGPNTNLSIQILPVLANENNWGFANEINLKVCEAIRLAKTIR